jgi:quercetin dioxygenase-like cupin family protein
MNNIKKITLASIALASICVTTAAAQIGVTRKIQIQEDLDIPGYQIILAEVTIDVGGREGRHRHSGMLVGQVIRGQLTLYVEGQPTREYSPGDSITIPPGVIHEGINNGDEPIVAVATFVVPKDEPVTTQAD